MDDQFYLRFQNRFRGSRAEISQRLEFYRPFIRTLRSLFPSPRALDLGCGRGEWLELLGSEGFSARGIDTNEAMLSTCRNLGLEADLADAVAALKELEDHSLELISSFHLIEHLPFADVLTLVSEAYRVLNPGGLLVLETPNPENILVATVGFHMDPTHRRPLPPVLMDFVAEDSGFSWRRCCRIGNHPSMREDTAELKASELVLNALVTGPDYCLLAGKQGTQGTGDLLAVVEELQAGYLLQTGSLQEKLAEIDWRHEVSLRQSETRYRELETRYQQSETRHQELETRHQELETRHQELEARHRHAILKAQQNSNQMLQQLAHIKGENDQLNHQLAAVYASTSWRLTAVLRTCRRWLGSRKRSEQEAMNVVSQAGSAESSPATQAIRNDLEQSAKDPKDPLVK